MSREIVRETTLVSQILPGSIETVVEREIMTELVTENIGPRGSPGQGEGTLRADLDRIDDLSLLFDNGLI